MAKQLPTKRLVVCLDGTWNDADAEGGDTNVARISRAVHATADKPQLVLYLRGVGTTGLGADRIISGATGLGIDDNIRSAYMFLAQNYLPGDEIYLFGFSRGAFTARSLVGLISATGLIRRGSLAHLGDAWLYYRTDKPHSPAEFMRRHPTVRAYADVKIRFVGVWDTVGSLGIPGHLFGDLNAHLYGFYDTGICPTVEIARHAMAIDEHRNTFVPTLWTGEAAPRTIKQVWFAGAHADVGGGYRTRALADIPLLWMAGEAAKAGLKLDPSCLPDPNALDPLAPRHDSSTGVFALSRMVPTVRQICGRDTDVAMLEHLYKPTNDHGDPVAEAVHHSVFDRYGRQASLCLDDKTGKLKEDVYAPSNVAALFDPATRKPAVPVARTLALPPPGDW